MKNVLILGGTRFVGRRLLERMLPGSGYNLTMFNRNRTNPGLFKEIPVIEGDRETADINKIFDRDWDYIIDISGYYPGSLQNLVDGIRGKVGRYIFVSTVSVYPLEKIMNRMVTEDEPTETCSEEEKADTSMATYGKRKAECERILLNENGIDKIILRPAVIYGKYDYTDRFYYWLYRAKTQKRFIMPDGGNNKFNMTYIDDFADLIIRAMDIEAHNTVYNATTHDPLPLNDLVEMITILFKDSHPGFVDIPADILESLGVEQWRSIPFWLKGDMCFANSKIAGDFNFKFRDIFSTVEETISSIPQWKEPAYGLGIKDEQKIIEKYSARLPFEN